MIILSIKPNISYKQYAELKNCSGETFNKYLRHISTEGERGEDRNKQFKELNTTCKILDKELLVLWGSSWKFLETIVIL